MGKKWIIFGFMMWKSCDIVMDITIFRFVEFVMLLWI